MFGGHPEPGLGRGGEAGMRLARHPGHRRAASVASLEGRPEADAIGVGQILELQFRLRQSQFLALIEADRTPERRQHADGKLRHVLPLLRILGEPADMPVDVVVGEGPAHPAVGDGIVEGFDAMANVVRREIGPQKIEGIAHVQLVAAGGIGRDRLQRAGSVAHLANRTACVIRIEQRAEPLEEADILRLGLVVEMALHAVGVDVGGIQTGLLAVGQMGGIVARFAVVEVVVDRIQAKAVDTAIEPEAHRRKKRLLHLAIVEVEVGLRGKEVVHVILFAHAVPLPGRTAEHRQPVVRRRAVRLGGSPDKPVRLGIVAARAAFLEPGMLIRRVRQHLVDDDLQAQSMRLGHHRVEIGERPEHRIDVAIVGDVIAHIRHRRGEEGRKPDRIDAEGGDIGQPFRHALEVADPIAVGVLEGARIDLVDDGAAPPIGIALLGLGLGRALRHARSSGEWGRGWVRLQYRPWRA